MGGERGWWGTADTGRGKSTVKKRINGRQERKGTSSETEGEKVYFNMRTICQKGGGRAEA